MHHRFDCSWVNDNYRQMVFSAPTCIMTLSSKMNDRHPRNPVIYKSMPTCGDDTLPEAKCTLESKQCRVGGEEIGYHGTGFEKDMPVFGSIISIDKKKCYNWLGIKLETND